MLKKIRDDEKLILTSLLMAMEIHYMERGSLLFWIYSEDRRRGQSIVVTKDQVKQIEDFLKNRYDFS